MTVKDDIATAVFCPSAKGIYTRFYVGRMTVGIVNAVSLEFNYIKIGEGAKAVAVTCYYMKGAVVIFINRRFNIAHNVAEEEYVFGFGVGRYNPIHSTAPAVGIGNDK